MKFLYSIAILPISVFLTGCAAIAEVAYDVAIERDRAQCEKHLSMSDRQACMQRVNAIERDSEERRRK